MSIESIILIVQLGIILVLGGIALGLERQLRRVEADVEIAELEAGYWLDQVPFPETVRFNTGGVVTFETRNR